jgi:hypothetical protein
MFDSRNEKNDIRHQKVCTTFGFFRFNPRIEPGSEVVLPEGAVKKDPMTAILQYITILAQVGTSLATLKLLTN